MPTADRLWKETTNRMARQTTVNVTRAFEQYARGAVSLDEVVGIQATMIAGAQRRAVTFNDMLLSAELTQRLEREFTATGLGWMETPDQQTARLSKALRGVFDADIDYVNQGKTREQRLQLEARSIRQRLDRLTGSEVIEASQWSRQTAMEAWESQGAIAGWYRRIGPNACEFCRLLGGYPDPAKYVHPVQHRMATHPHCTCSQAWVTEVEPWQKWVGPREQMKDLAPPPVEPSIPTLPKPTTDIEAQRQITQLSQLKQKRQQEIYRRHDDLPLSDKIYKLAEDPLYLELKDEIDRLVELRSTLRQQALPKKLTAKNTPTDVDGLEALLKERRAARDARRLALEEVGIYDIGNDPVWKALTNQVKKLEPKLEQAKAAQKLAESRLSVAARPGDVWDDIPAHLSGYTDEARSYQVGKVPDNVLDVRDGTNPGFGSGREYAVNCQRVSQTFELRARGYDVVAKPNKKTRGASGKVKNGKMQRWDGDLTDEDIMSGWRTKSGATRSAPRNLTTDQVVSQLETWEEGWRGFIICEWKGPGNSAHIFNVVIKDGKAVFVEAQTRLGSAPIWTEGRGGLVKNAQGKLVRQPSGRVMHKYAQKWIDGRVGLVRVDDMVPVMERLVQQEVMRPA